MSDLYRRRLAIVIPWEFIEDDFISQDTVVRDIPYHFCLPFDLETRIIGAERDIDRMNIVLYIQHPNLPVGIPGQCCPQVRIDRLREEYPYLLSQPKRIHYVMNVKEQNFCAELTALLMKHGYGIADSPHIYELQAGPDSDYGRTASIDGEGHLEFV